MRTIYYLGTFALACACWAADFGTGPDKLKYTLFFTKTSVPAKSVVHFACRNIVNNRYLISKDRKRVCWIKSPEDYITILKGIGQPYDREKVAAAETCPEAYSALAFCDPKKGRKF